MLNRITIRFKKLYPDAVVPKYGTDYAAGADLYAYTNDDIVIAPGETKMIHTGIALEIPSGYVGLTHARSGLALREGLAPANKVGVLDSDYRGEIMVALFNHSSEKRTVTNGERVAQLIIVPYMTADYVETDELSETERGNGGFGSTGK